MSIDLETIIKEVTDDVVNLAKEEAKNYIDQATHDAVDFVKLVYDNLSRWASAVIKEELTLDELKFLIKGQKELLVMHSLSQAGLAAVRVQRIRDGIINIVFNAVSTAIFGSNDTSRVVDPNILTQMVPGAMSEKHMGSLVTAEYIWIDGSFPTKKLRSKTKVLSNPNTSASLISPVMQLKDFPEWGFDGSSTGQATGHDSDCILKPIAVYRDPIRGGNDSYLVMCEVYTGDGDPHSTNTRHQLKYLLENTDQEPWVGFEQEYTMFKENAPLGWPICKHGRSALPPSQGPYYCGVGSDEAFGRHVVEEHMRACIDIGISICGINAEVMPGQWEFQVGYRGDNPRLSNPLHASDDLWMARWLLYRISENYGITITLDVKPVSGDWNGAGCHTNFSTSATRSKDTGMAAITAAISKLEQSHNDHIAVYGHGLERRLTGLHETCDIKTFKSGVADRGSSIRIPRHVNTAGYGYFEDRRPGANCDPYLVSAALVRTVCF